jgi:hypothetical protein
VADRQLVRAQLARMEQPEHLDVREVRVQQRPELGGTVLVHVPRVAGALGAGRREREHVRRRDVGDVADSLEVLEQLARFLHVLDRLQEHDCVAGLGERLDHVAREAQSRPRVARLRVLVRLGVGVDADDRRCAVGQQVRAIALATGHVDDAQAAHLAADPLVHDEVPLEPVVLLGNVGQRALAGELQRRHAGRLIALDVDGGVHQVRVRLHFRDL